MTRLIIALSAFGLLVSALPAVAAPPHKGWTYHGHHYMHRKMSHGHWHYY
jgi:hypothetical protein